MIFWSIHFFFVPLQKKDMIVVRIGLGRSKDRNTTWFNLDSKEAWERCVHEWSLKKNSGKPIFVSYNGRAYKEINGVKLLELKNKL